MALTDAAIRNAKPREKPYKVADSKGLYLQINPAGSKLWRLKYRINGVERKLALGSYPEISLAEAREARDAVAVGQVERRDRRAAAGVVDAVLKLLEPTSGRVLFEGKDVTTYKGKELKSLRRRVQPIFQNPYGTLDPMYSIYSTIEEPLRQIVLKHFNAAAVRQREDSEKLSISLQADLAGCDLAQGGPIVALAGEAASRRVQNVLTGGLGVAAAGYGEPQGGHRVRSLPGIFVIEC